MDTYTAGTILILFCGAALGFFFAPDRERWWGTWFGFGIAFNLALLGWVVYVAHHFIVKFW